MTEFEGDSDDTLVTMDESVSMSQESVTELVKQLLLNLNGGEIHYSEVTAAIEAETQVQRHINGEGVSIW